MNVVPVCLSMIGDIKVYECHLIKSNDITTPLWRSTLRTSIKDLFLLPKFDKSSPSVTRDKKICQSHMIMR